METGIQTIPVSLIDTDPGQPRKEFDGEALAQLAKSIETNGLLQPICLRKNGGDRFMVIAGERRLRAARMLGWQNIPAIVKHVTEAEFRKLQMLENVVRESLNPVELAQGFKAMMDEGMSSRDIADALGWDAGNVTYYVAILKCREEALHLVAIGQIGMTVARQMAKLSANGQLMALRVFQMRRYSTEEMIAICERIYAQENQIEMLDTNSYSSADLKRLGRFRHLFNRFYKELRWLCSKPELAEKMRLGQEQVKEVETKMRWLDKLLRRR